MNIREKHRELFGAEPVAAVRAPGRVNLIGEHTDYNDGFVLPAALQFEVRMTASPRSDRQVRLYSITFQQSTTFSLDEIAPSVEASWSNYTRGVASILQKEGYPLSGMNAIIEGTVPIASGLSSSAALELASLLVYEGVGQFKIDPVSRALLAQRAEREFVGVQCGIMDQFISSLGRRDHALLIDTRSLKYEPAPLPTGGIAIVVANTNVKRGLVDSEYNTRRKECEEAVAALKEIYPAVKALRDVDKAMLEENKARLREVVYRRARHVITENDRTVQAVQTLKAGDMAQFGRLMNESHASLRDDYQVSCQELDILVELAQNVSGVYGSRMTGAGFGGCTVSLVGSNAVGAFQSAVAPRYREATGLETTISVCQASDGAGPLP